MLHIRFVTFSIYEIEITIQFYIINYDENRRTFCFREKKKKENFLSYLYFFCLIVRQIEDFLSSNVHPRTLCSYRSVGICIGIAMPSSITTTEDAFLRARASREHTWTRQGVLTTGLKARNKGKRGAFDRYVWTYLYVYTVSTCVFFYAFVYNCFMDSDLYFIFYFLCVIVMFLQNYTLVDKK